MGSRAFAHDNRPENWTCTRMWRIHGGDRYLPHVFFLVSFRPFAFLPLPRDKVPGVRSKGPGQGTKTEDLDRISFYVLLFVGSDESIKLIIYVRSTKKNAGGTGQSKRFSSALV